MEPDPVQETVPEEPLSEERPLMEGAALVSGGGKPGGAEEVPEVAQAGTAHTSIESSTLGWSRFSGASGGEVT